MPTNRGYVFSQRSLDVMHEVEAGLETLCHQAMIIANERKLHCPDFGISRGFSTAEEQNRLWQNGRDMEGNIIDASKVVTNCDGYKVISNHQKGIAIDFFALGEDGKADWSAQAAALVATCFFEAASNLGINIDWGGSYRSISDGWHIELVI